MLVFRTGLGRLRAVTLRRFAACLLSLTMLQLGMVRADVCVAHADVAVTSGDVATVFMLIRSSGTLKNGQEVGYWVRVSNGFQRSHGAWLITHEHVSLPVDLRTRSAVMDLVP